MRIFATITVFLSLCLSGAAQAQNHYFEGPSPRFEAIDPIFVVTDKNIAISLPKLIKIPNVRHRELQIHEYVYDNNFKRIDASRSYNVERDYPRLFERIPKNKGGTYMETGPRGYSHIFVTSNPKTGKVHRETVKFDYLRGGEGFKVFGANGTDAGYIYLFGKLPFSSKKKRDPNKFKYDVVYIDASGRKVFQSHFEFGVKKNTLGPIIAYMSKGKIHLLVENLKEGGGRSALIFDMTGNIVERTPEQPREDLFDLVKTANYRISKNIYRKLTLDDWRITNVEFDDAGSVYLIGQLENTMSKEINGSREWVATYK